MNNISGQVVAGIARHVLGAGGAFLVSQGWAEPGMVDEAVGAASLLIAFGWSVFAKVRS